ncbi:MULTISPECIES: hypothetical protein [unclassified Nocardioides]|uniref:hypothetical protein n=1 Tax=unclassified Nocardioides TaxID=2615069 RepID=UPI0006FC5729|nr:MULTISPECIES: hypothetical protein [unclassified Nocardioides]KQY64334.1 hypothetical protein ASD30_05165 [Nocardioides sp. Root140]KQZ70253.1 hypothetical protein ASD66_11440 [Nocardioides sp. Root151]KRF16350.1 hypothetical protein ASH02_07190 [Nocardioides sp. Soil796]
MPSFIPTHEETLEDQRLYTQARLVKVQCLDCLARVGVKKNSDHHTSIQWDHEALGQCQEFARMSSQPAGRAVHTACPRLLGTIEAAVREGEIPIGAEDGY